MTQVGEKANVDVAAKEKPKVKKINAKITRIALDTTVKVALNKATITAPHWEEKDKETVKDKDNQSKKPAAYKRDGAGGPKTFKVTVHVTQSENVSGGATLKGTLGNLMFKGALASVDAKEHDVTVTIENLPDHIAYVKGDATWALEVPDTKNTLALSSTRMELAFVYDTPANYFQNQKGVWAEALRFILRPGRASLTGKKTEAEIVERIVTFCHGRCGLMYDTKKGKSYYGVSGGGGDFKLQSYINTMSTAHAANCYDQAGAVQSLCGALGVKVDWIFLMPYGFISNTNLLGWGQCNNPFFEGNKIRLAVEKANAKNEIIQLKKRKQDCELKRKATQPKSVADADWNKHLNDLDNELKKADDDMQKNAKKLKEILDAEKAVCQRDNPYRTRFGNHAFCALGGKSGKILDACAGPHRGTETAAQYVTAAIDQATTLYATVGGSPGKDSDMLLYMGVTGVE